MTEVTPSSGHQVQIYEGSNLVQQNIGAGTHTVDFTCAGTSTFYIYRSSSGSD